MQQPLVRTTLVLSLCTTLGCQTVMPLPVERSVGSTVPPSLQVPFSVERLAVLYPKTSNRELLDAYAKLAGASFQLKASRPWLRIVERFDLPAIHSEQQFQLSGAVSDETAIRVGRLLGVDSILLYRIDGPNLRDRVLASIYGGLPPYTVTSKVLRVESAEVVYHNVVTAPVAQHSGPGVFFGGTFYQASSFSTALDRGVAATITDLRRAFR